MRLLFFVGQLSLLVYRHDLALHEKKSNASNPHRLVECRGTGAFAGKSGEIRAHFSGRDGNTSGDELGEDEDSDENDGENCGEEKKSGKVSLCSRARLRSRRRSCRVCWPQHGVL